MKRIVTGAVVVAALVGFIAFYCRLATFQPTSAIASRPVQSRKEPEVSKQAPSGVALASTAIAPAQLRAVTHEDAVRYLESIVNQVRHKDAMMPELNFSPEDDASPQERAEIMAMRQSAAARGQLLIAARSKDGRLHLDFDGGDFPRDFVPPNIRSALTERDWETFQVQMKVSTMRNSGFGRSRDQAKEPNKAPEPTPTSVTPPANER